MTCLFVCCLCAVLPGWKKIDIIAAGGEVKGHKQRALALVPEGCRAKPLQFTLGHNDFQ